MTKNSGRERTKTRSQSTWKEYQRRSYKHLCITSQTATLWNRAVNRKQKVAEAEPLESRTIMREATPNNTLCHRFNRSIASSCLRRFPRELDGKYLTQKSFLAVSFAVETCPERREGFKKISSTSGLQQTPPLTKKETTIKRGSTSAFQVCPKGSF